METVKVVIFVALWLLFLLSIILVLKEQYDAKKCKWIAEGRKRGLERAKWNVEKVFQKLAPIEWENPRVNNFKCNFLDAYEALIVIIEEEGRYMVLIKKYGYVLLEDTNYFFTLEDALKYVDSFRIKLLNSIYNKTL